MRILSAAALALLVAGCEPVPDPGPPTGIPPTTGMRRDAGTDAGVDGGLDAGASADAGQPDAGLVTDGGSADAGGPSDAGVDGGTVDGGPLDAGDVDAGVFDGGLVDAGSFDGGADAGVLDAGNGLRTCVPDPDGLVVHASGFQVATFASGPPLVDPMGITFGLDGRMYVVNSRSWFSTTLAAGEVLRSTGDGGFETFLSNTSLSGPGWIAFAPGGLDGGPGLAYLGTEDLDEAALSSSDLLFSFDGVTLTQGPAVQDVEKLQFGPGGAFGTDLYFVGRQNELIATPNPGRLFRWSPTGTQAPQVVALSSGMSTLGKITGFTFANGGQLGTDLYVSTTLDSNLTPMASQALWRVTSALAVTQVANNVVFEDLAASPSASGPWGDYVYAMSHTSGAWVVSRVSPTGQVTTFIDGLLRGGSIQFGADGAMYFTDLWDSSIRRVTVCNP